MEAPLVATFAGYEKTAESTAEWAPTEKEEKQLQQSTPITLQQLKTEYSAWEVHDIDAKPSDQKGEVIYSLKIGRIVAETPGSTPLTETKTVRIDAEAYNFLLKRWNKRMCVYRLTLDDPAEAGK